MTDLSGVVTVIETYLSSGILYLQTLVLEDRRQNCHVEPFRQETKSPKWQHQGPSQSFVESSSAKTY